MSNTSSRIKRLKEAVQRSAPAVCTERALIWTSFFKKRKNRAKPVSIGIAEALSRVLAQKSITIYPGELIVGNYTSKRVGGSIYPELHGVPVMLDLLKFRHRKINPLQITAGETIKLIKIIPFWLFRFMPLKAHASIRETARFIIDQLQARFYLINESGGIAHLAPDYEKLITIGTRGIIKEAGELKKKTASNTEERAFLGSIEIIACGLEHFGNRYGLLAEKMAKSETGTRRNELQKIETACCNCLKKGAGSFHEALQAVFFAQIAINLESLDNAICPGRMDQYLYPFYRHDLDKKILTREKAKELVACFSVKMSEIIPVFSEHLTNFHGGMFNGQVVTVGGTDKNGNDAANALTYIFLEVMDELRMRQPNYHARIHANAPAGYLENICSLLAGGSNSPALYNDDVIVQTMCRHGYALKDARDYTAVGCVEPVSQGKSFASTDAAIVNVPILLEMALNEGKCFRAKTRTGIKTMPPENMRSMADVKSAFEKQLNHMLSSLIKDLKAVETANRKFHPTPLTSMLVKGCIENRTCSTAGGARYNFSGVQCVAPVDTGDSLYAIEKAVFKDKKISLPGLVSMLKENFPDQALKHYLKALPKYGNDIPEVDLWTGYVVETFAGTLSSFGKNTRGGNYVTGLYSVTSHEYFGRITGTLPSGRTKGEAFASGISPGNGMDKNGPTALLNSVNRLDVTRFANGINFNIKFPPRTLKGKRGTSVLAGLLTTYFQRGGMQVQVNVLDPQVLIAARDNPGLYPHLLVRVSGYSAYFNDLSAAMKDEIIQRSCIELFGN